ncbi:hypothetical protein PQC39_gp093 [Vibrio phage Vp_R1]|uniref:Uncharacterized protein n=1 Tax=Vibrio phage Vp_R1 TaxID=2059867 RepID=A0A2H5BQ47_9CAUD|nr:hypothetical protein PQC39_gp093 [Vibrio phage Vp_R1]AUG88457.1 hypothetical protein VPR_093 [Vibrio phage Vp_R1]
MKDIDFSKSHCGVMLCTLSQTLEFMPELEQVLEELTPELEMGWDDYLIDVKVHMLMPNQFPCIPNWHFDFRPRDENGELDKSFDVNGELPKMYMWLSGSPLTLYKSRDGEEYEKPAKQWHSFTQADLHRGQMSEEHTWRCFIRVIPKKFVHGFTKNVGTRRIHTQVYCDSRTFHW